MPGPEARRGRTARPGLRRAAWLVIAGLVLGGAIVLGASMILDASDYYEHRLAAALPAPSGRR